MDIGVLTDSIEMGAYLHISNSSGGSVGFSDAFSLVFNLDTFNSYRCT